MIRKRGNQKEILTPKTEVEKTKLTIRYIYFCCGSFDQELFSVPALVFELAQLLTLDSFDIF